MHKLLAKAFGAGCLVVAFLGIAGNAMAATAPASSGAGIQAAPVQAYGAHAGGSYLLPVTVTNPGSGPETMTFRIERLSAGHGITVPPSWIRTGSVRLAAGEPATVQLRLTIPAGAAPGRYFSGVVAYGSTAGATGGANLGTAAETKLIITVTVPEYQTTANRRMT